MRTTTTMTTIKSKTENKSLPSYLPFPTNLNVSPSSTRTAFVIHVYPPSSELFYGARLYRMGGPSGAAPLFSLMELRATPPAQQPHLTQPTAPRFSGSPPLSIPQFHCQSLFMYSRVRTLGLVSSFGSVLLIFCWMNYFLLLGLFSFFCLSVPYFSQ